MGFVKLYLATILNDFKELSVPTYENLVRALLDSKNPQLLCRRPRTVHFAHMTCLSGKKIIILLREFSFISIYF